MATRIETKQHTSQPEIRAHHTSPEAVLAKKIQKLEKHIDRLEYMAEHCPRGKAGRDKKAHLIPLIVDYKQTLQSLKPSQGRASLVSDSAPVAEAESQPTIPTDQPDRITTAFDSARAAIQHFCVDIHPTKSSVPWHFEPIVPGKARPSADFYITTLAIDTARSGPRGESITQSRDTHYAVFDR